MPKSPIISIKPIEFQWETLDPFLFCAYHIDFYPGGKNNLGPDPSELKGRNIGQDFQVKNGWRMYHGEKVPGFPSHPHRGFETVTVVRKGIIDHTDSQGAKGRYSSGDVQWMTAGRGLQHCEMFPLINEENSNTTELFQIWLNLPSSKKLVDPYFTMLWKETIPVYTHKDSNGNTIEMILIAGKLGGMSAPSPAPNSWAADPKNSVAIWVGKLDPHANWILPASTEGINRMLYFYRGNGVRLLDTEVSGMKSVRVLPQYDLEIKNGDSETEFLMLQGKPIGEPVVQYGPFVMNTPEEIQKTFMDYKLTQFGGWPFDTYEPVHPREKGRFALHSDGREELPGPNMSITRS